MINSQLNIKLGQFMEEKSNAVLKKIKSRKAVSLSEVWNAKEFDNHATQHNWGMEKLLHIIFCFSVVSNLKLREFLGKNQNDFWRNHSTSQILTIQIIKGVCAKRSQGNTFIHKSLLGILIHTQRKKGANTTCIWSRQRNCYSYNHTLQKHENNGSLTW